MKTVKVRIACAIDTRGGYNAVGWCISPIVAQWIGRRLMECAA